MHSGQLQAPRKCEKLWTLPPIETVAMLLGHASPAVTMRSYSPWVRQDSLERAVKAAWG